MPPSSRASASNSLSQAWVLEMLSQVWALVIKDSERTRKTLVNPIADQLFTTRSQEVPYWALNWRPEIPTSLSVIPPERCPFEAASPRVNL